jgi:TctA family transporter
MPHDRTAVHAERDVADILLGSITLALAIVALASLKGAPFGPPGRLSDWLLPATVAGLLGVVSLGLILRGLLLSRGRVDRWRPRDILIVTALVVGVDLAWWQWGRAMMLHLGPSDLAAMMVCALSIAVALARFSRFRAFAMVLVGLLLATVGTDISTGEARFTMGLNELADGISSAVLALGLLVAADGLLCLASPAAYLESYARWVAGWFDRRLSTSAGIGLRVAGAIAVAAACYGAFALNNAVWDVCVVLVLGVFGVVCKLIGANRLVLVMAFGYALLIEENIRRALMIARGDPSTFLTRPYSAGFIILTCVILAGVTLTSIRRTLNPQHS